MSEYDFDMFTLGAGSGGVASSRRAGSYGAKVAICEESRVGGTCVIRGCVPKKILVYGSHFAHEIADAGGFGWSVGARSLDWGDQRRTLMREIEELDARVGRRDDELRVTMSGGVATVVPGDSLDALLQRADDALYRAKSGGRNRVELETLDAD